MVDKKAFLIATVSFLSLAFLIHYFDGMPEIDADYILAIIVLFVFYLLLSIICALLVAAFPFKTNKTPTKTEIRARLPGLCIFLCVIGFIGFILTRPSYAKTKAAESTDCIKIKYGKYKVGDYLIERYGQNQIETNIQTKHKTVYDISWLNDCEFELINSKDSLDVSKIKITSVTDKYYDCLTVYEGRVVEQQIQIIKKGL